MYYPMKNLEIFAWCLWIAERNPGSRPSTWKARENPGSRPWTFDDCEFHLPQLAYMWLCLERSEQFSPAQPIVKPSSCRVSWPVLRPVTSTQPLNPTKFMNRPQCCGSGMDPLGSEIICLLRSGSASDTGLGLDPDPDLQGCGSGSEMIFNLGSGSVINSGFWSGSKLSSVSN